MEARNMPCHRLYNGLNPCEWRVFKRHEHERGKEFALSLVPKRLMLSKLRLDVEIENATKNISCFQISGKNAL